MSLLKYCYLTDLAYILCLLPIVYGLSVEGYIYVHLCIYTGQFAICIVYIHVLIHTK